MKKKIMAKIWLVREGNGGKKEKNRTEQKKEKIVEEMVLGWLVLVLYMAPKVRRTSITNFEFYNHFMKKMMM